MAARRCRGAKGRFKKCGSGGGGTRRKRGKSKGRCLRYSKGKRRCLKRG
jgi:hypothetical protein